VSLFGITEISVKITERNSWLTEQILVKWYVKLTQNTAYVSLCNSFHSDIFLSGFLS